MILPLLLCLFVYSVAIAVAIAITITIVIAIAIAIAVAVDVQFFFFFSLFLQTVWVHCTRNHFICLSPRKISSKIRNFVFSRNCSRKKLKKKQNFFLKLFSTWNQTFFCCNSSKTEKESEREREKDRREKQTEFIYLKKKSICNHTTTHAMSGHDKCLLFEIRDW